MTTVTISREELYHHVWMTPLLRLAVQFGVSNVALGKLCRRLNVPTPGRGYWARVAAGQTPKRRPLPKATGNQAFVRVTMDPTPVTVVHPPRVKPPEVAIPANLEDAHQVTQRLAAMMQRARVDEHERMMVGGDLLVVTVATHRRALLLLSGLCRALNERGHPVVVEGTAERATLSTSIEGEAASISMVECLERIPRTPTSEEPDRVIKRDARGALYDYAPDGRIRLTIDGSTWADTVKRRLERVLGRVVIHVEAAAEAKKARRAHVARLQAEEEERQRRLDRERAQARREQQLQAYGQLLASDLEQMVAEFSRANRIRQFLDAFESTLEAGQRSESVERWMSAARSYATRLDPLSRAHLVPKDPEPSEEELDAATANLKEAAEQRGKSPGTRADFRTVG